jgi:hypothetical protein
MHQKMSNGCISWDLFNKSTQGIVRGAQEEFLAQSEDSLIDARLGDSCLTTFINKWSANNSGPFDILQRYVVHVALNVVQVFQSNQDSLALSGFIIDCVDLVARKRGVSQDLDLCSFGQVNLGPGGEMDCLEYFAVNLLNAELRLKRSDGQLNGFGDYESDSNFVVVVPVLLQRATEIESAHSGLKESSIWISMKTRSHWLAAGFYLDRSRLSQNICESRTAEDLGIKQVEYYNPLPHLTFGSASVVCENSSSDVSQEGLDLIGRFYPCLLSRHSVMIFKRPRLSLERDNNSWIS